MKKETKSEIVKGFKGFDKDLKCRDFQYEIGKEYEDKGNIKICLKGFHFCTDPLDVFSYYTPGMSRFATVETDGITQNDNNDSKVVSNKLKINAEIGLKEIIKAGVEWIFEQTKISKDTHATSGDGANSATSGYRANSATSGDGANSATSGDRANSATSGYGANSATSGDNTVSAAIGINSHAKASKGSWIVLTEWIEKDDKWIIKSVKTAKIDGKKLKADTFYKLENGKFIEVS